MIATVIQKVKALDKNNLDMDENNVIQNINQFDQLGNELPQGARRNPADADQRYRDFNEERLHPLNIQSFEKIAKELVAANKRRQTLPNLWQEELELFGSI